MVKGRDSALFCSWGRRLRRPAGRRSPVWLFLSLLSFRSCSLADCESVCGPDQRWWPVSGGFSLMIVIRGWIGLSEELC